MNNNSDDTNANRADGDPAKPSKRSRTLEELSLSAVATALGELRFATIKEIGSVTNRVLDTVVKRAETQNPVATAQLPPPLPAPPFDWPLKPASTSQIDYLITRHVFHLVSDDGNDPLFIYPTFDGTVTVSANAEETFTMRRMFGIVITHFEDDLRSFYWGWGRSLGPSGSDIMKSNAIVSVPRGGISSSFYFAVSYNQQLIDPRRYLPSAHITVVKPGENDFGYINPTLWNWAYQVLGSAEPQQ